MKTHASSDFCVGAEPIPGYVLREKIGQGGFGEVWKATAPGDLEKAIKLVYGRLGEHEADRELRSLEHIRAVHHPFLLTLERFEILERRVVIVTELADGSLEDLHQHQQKRGSCGIPRDELLHFLREAADALDHLHQAHGLQHLDIKPGNLLYVGRHIKVADFGLMRQMKDSPYTVLGGMTPSYAAPEMFDGRPGIHTDQYALAIVFQELLTGRRPFSGRTLAQLASQHVHAAPDLGPLPAADRPVVARALEKDPARRYSSCTEFIDRLAHTNREPSRSPAAFAPRENASCETTTSGTHGSSVDRAEVEDLPAPSIGAETAPAGGVRGVLAIGGAGLEIVDRLLQQTDAAGAAMSASLLIDTDAERIASCSCARDPAVDSLVVPLKTPQQYRGCGAERLGSISRRWLFNVPRSGRTEGLRPLGRLALLDHAAVVTTKLQQFVDRIGRAAGEGNAEIYVVCSIAGGTGSGMLLDLVHLLRQLLDDSGLAGSSIRPILLSAWNERNTSPLQIASAHAALRELAYFMVPSHSYPGDSGAGFPAVPSARSPLASPYILEPQGTWEATVQQVVDYLHLDHGASGKILSAARRAAPAKAGGAGTAPALHSFTVNRLEGTALLAAGPLALLALQSAAARLVSMPAQTAPHTRLPQRLLEQFGLGGAGTADTGGGDPTARGDAARFSELLRAELLREVESQRSTLAEAAETAAATREYLDRLAATACLQPSDTNATSPEEAWVAVIAKQVGTTARRIIDVLARGIELQQQIQRSVGVLQQGDDPLDVEQIEREERDTLARLAAEARRLVLRELFRAAGARHLPEDWAAERVDALTEALQQRASQLLQTPQETELDDGSADAETPLRRAVDAATSPCLRFGGGQRLFALVGRSCDSPLLARRLTELRQRETPVFVVPGIGTWIVAEVQQIPLSEMLSRLVTRLGPEAQLSSRLTSRTDIDWADA